MANRTLRRRPHVQHKVIVRQLRQDIVAGRYAPGSQLPTRITLEDRFGASSATVQRALDRLMHDGFAEVHGRQGTFVSGTPPHLCNVALVLPVSFPSSLFYEVLVRAAGVLTQERAQAAASREPSDGNKPDALCFTEYRFSTLVDHREGWEQLCADAAAHRFGGVVYAMPPFELLGLEAKLEPGLPQVAIAAAGSPSLPAVTPDFRSFISRAIDSLVSRGRRRIAHLRFDTHHSSPEQFISAIEGLLPEVRPYWVQSVGGYRSNRGIAQVVNLLMQLEGDKKPDALLIHDDNLVEPAVAGLMAAGVRVGQDMDVIAHANFPLPTHGALPIQRLGFDCVEILRRCVAVIDDLRAGRTPQTFTTVPPKFEDELIQTI